MSPRTLLLLVLLPLLALAAPGAAQAATCTFQAGSDWNTAANWSCGAVPTAADDVVIPNTGGASPTLSTLPDGAANSIDLQSGRTLGVSDGRTLTVGTGASSFAGALSVTEQAKLRLNGTTIWSAGNWFVTATVENAGTLNITGNTTASEFFGGQLRNLATGTLNRTTSTGTALLSLPFENDGAVTVSTSRTRRSSASRARRSPATRPVRPRAAVGSSTGSTSAPATSTSSGRCWRTTPPRTPPATATSPAPDSGSSRGASTSTPPPAAV